MTRHQHSVPHRLDRIPASARARFTSRPIVAIVGRPNVGKSTLFNRLAGARLAIVHDEPGVTRDRHYADAFARGVEYSLIDTGGYDPDSDDPMRQGIARHVLAAIEEADVVISVLDATVDLTAADREAVQLLRASQRPVIYVANKADSPNTDAFAYEFYRLGIDRIFPISALHGRGIAELEEAIIAAIPPEPDAASDPFEGMDDVPRVALVGRPNAGKSSLLNRLAGEERSLVDARPGTTRDTVDALVKVKIKTDDGVREQSLVILDTAGIRKKAKVHETIEALSVMRAVRAIERAEVAVIMVDAIDGVAEQDAKIAGLAVDRGRAVVIVLNKCDELDNKEQERAEVLAREKLSFVPWAPVVRLSAKTGRGVGHLAEVVTKVREQWCGRVTTGQVNRFFAEVLATHPPPTQSGRAVRLYFVTQAETRPPTFIVVTNHPDYVHFSYQRYILNQIRERFGFEGTPLKVRYRAKRRRPKGHESEDDRDGTLDEVVIEQELGGDGVHEVEGLDEREVERLMRGGDVREPVKGSASGERDEDDDAIESDGAEVAEEPENGRAKRRPRTVKAVVDEAPKKPAGKARSKPKAKASTKRIAATKSKTAEARASKAAKKPSSKRAEPSTSKPTGARSSKPSVSRSSKPAGGRGGKPSGTRRR